MSHWIPAVPALLAAAAALLVPGLAAGFALRLRGFWLWAAAGPISVSIITLASVALSLLGAPWSPFSVLAVGAVIAVGVWALSRFVFRQLPLAIVDAESGGASGAGKRELPGRAWITVLALVVAGAVMFWRITESIGEPSNISQTFDNIFHLNAVRFVLDTGDASPLTIGRMNSPSGNLGFYPSGWHAIVALVVQLSGASIPVATTSTIAIVAAVVWVSGVLLLARTLFGARDAVTLCAAALAPGFAIFPILMTSYGVLYPMFLGFALVPAALSAALGLTGLERRALNLNPPTRWLLLLGLLPGIALAHPGALMAGLAMTVPMVLVWAWDRLRRRERVVTTLVLLAAYLLGGLIALVKVRPSREQATWGAETSKSDALLRFLDSQLMRDTVPVLVGALVLIGVVVAIVRHRRGDVALLGMYVVAGGLFIVTAAVEWIGLRFWLTGIWYQNIPRVEAITVFATLPLAILGASWIIEFVTARLRARTLTTAVAVIAGVALLAGAQASSSLTNISVASQSTYRFSDDAALLSTDELALLERLDAEVPSDTTIVTNGWTGAGLAYAYADRWVTMPHVMVDFTPEAVIINGALRGATPGSETCDAVERERAGFVLDFGEREVHGGDHDFPGLDDLDTSSAVELVDQEGDAKLYRIIGCDPAAASETADD